MTSSSTPDAASANAPGHRGIGCLVVTGATTSVSSPENTRLRSRVGFEGGGAIDTPVGTSGAVGGAGVGTSALSLRSTNPADSVLRSASGDCTARYEMSGSARAVSTHFKPALRAAHSPPQ